MTTLTIKVNERNKKGKAFLELVDLFNSEKKKSVEVVGVESPYDPKFVKMVRSAEKAANFKKIDPENIWESLGLK